jgi:hypothetical protein
VTIEVGYLQGDGSAPEHSAHLMRQIHASITTEGVAKTNGNDDLLVTQDTGANRKVKVAKGVAFVEGDTVADQGLYSFVSDAAETINIDPSDPTNPRIDIIVAQVSDTFYGDPADEGTLIAITGTPDPAPDPPATPDSALLLAQVDVAAGATVITNADITDERTRMGGGGGGETGTLRATVVLSADQTIGHGADQTINWDAALEDVGDWWSNSNPSRLTAPRDCVVIAGVQIGWDTGANGGERRGVKITENAAHTKRAHDQEVMDSNTWPTGSAPVQGCTMRPLKMVAGEYLEARAFQDRPSLDLDIIADSGETFFWILVVG